MLLTTDAVCVYSTINALCLRVNWSVVDGASWYSVYRSPIPHDSFVQVAASVPGLTFYDDPKTQETLNLRNVWYYRVTATDTGGEGPMSSPATFLPYQELSQPATPAIGLSLWGLIY